MFALAACAPSSSGREAKLSVTRRHTLQPRYAQTRRSRGAAAVVRAAGGGSSRLRSLADQLPDPLLRASIVEPVAFWGGMVAGADHGACTRTVSWGSRL